jgi:hypothetical protein
MLAESSSGPRIGASCRDQRPPRRTVGGHPTKASRDMGRRTVTSAWERPRKDRTPAGAAGLSHIPTDPCARPRAPGRTPQRHSESRQIHLYRKMKKRFRTTHASTGGKGRCSTAKCQATKPPGAAPRVQNSVGKGRSRALGAPGRASASASAARTRSAKAARGRPQSAAFSE